MQLFFIRHGETEWSLNRRHTGRSEIELTARGEEEARKLKPWLSEIPFTRVFVSPRSRARTTCDLAGLGSAAEIVPDLAEWDYGDFEGLTSQEIRKGKPDWNVFRDGCPGGESPSQVSDRADRLIARLRELEGNVALFSHGHFGRVVAARWVGLAIIEGQHFGLSTASLGILGYEPSHPETPVVALWNAVPGFFAGG